MYMAYVYGILLDYVRLTASDGTYGTRRTQEVEVGVGADTRYGTIEQRSRIEDRIEKKVVVARRKRPKPSPPRRARLAEQGVSPAPTPRAKAYNEVLPPHPPRCRPPHPHQRAHDAAAPAHPVAAAIPGLGPREDIRDLPPASDPAVPGRDMGCRQGVY
ncbi:hypothetical protein V496_05284 [Pseudogymnoascus sp. VKM F-4515 (FW-2607)]|nr:hypothetical protein V496_05284 [Pseudogymnoascus sp. VKM F-4515 (FW-2607)]